MSTEIGNTEFELFDARGRFVMPSEEQIAGLNEGTREQWSAVRDAAMEHDEISAALRTSEQRVSNLMKEVRELELYIRTTFPGQTREQAVREFLNTERMKRP